jgi:hypothetical protein
MKNTTKPLKTLVAIAQHFQLHRNTVSKWFAKPDAPKRGPDGYDFAQVAEWVKTCAQTEVSMSKTSMPMATAKLNEVLERVRKLSIANDLACRALVKRIDVANALGKVCARAKNILYRKLVDELPADFSNDISGNRIIANKLADEICVELQGMAELLKGL